VKIRASSVCALLLVVTIGIVVSLFRQTASSHPFFYDEADYMYAGTRGFVDNYLDRPSLSTVEFIRKGLELSRDRSQRSNMSQFVRSSGDITFYRHYHGPVYAYWIALGQALGLHDESSYRASGLVIHALVTFLIFLYFRKAFPEYSPFAALAAALAFLTDRTALVSATNVTQHVMFGLTACLTLFPLALFCRTGNRGFWYLTAVALGISFSTVETSFVLVAAVLIVLGLIGLREGWKPVGLLFLKGLPVFLCTILLIWPKGIVALGALKGYVYLGYIALVKKTFTPMSPFALWSFKVRVYPEEFVIPALALVAATLGWKRLAARMAILPYLVYTWTFLAVTLVVTAPYTYYHDSLLMSSSVIVGVAFGELWRRSTGIRIAAAAILLLSLGVMNARYYRETREVEAAPDSRLALLNYIRRDTRMALYVPYVLVPTLHYYKPQLTAVGYDTNWSAADVASALKAAGEGAELLCEQNLCLDVARQLKTTPLAPVMAPDKELNQGPLYSVTVDTGLPNQ